MNSLNPSTLGSASTPRFDVFQYHESSELLGAYIAHRKASGRYFSISSWSKKLELPTSGIIVNILKKRRTLAEDLAERIAGSMELSPLEREYFLTLVAWERARNAASRAEDTLGRKLASLRLRERTRVLDERSVEEVSHLKTIAVKEALSLCQDRPSVAWIRERVTLPMSDTEIEAVLESLVKVGVLVRANDGSLSVIDANIESANDVSSSGVRRFHRESLDHAKDALENVPLQARHFTSYVMPVDENRIAEAKQVIEEFIDGFVARFEATSPGANAVYQLNLNYVPLTRQIEMEKQV